jgi:hypothetical protein
MRSHEIFQRISPELAAEILGFLHGADKAIYKGIVQGLANQRRLRPVFIERKPRDERNSWIKAALGRPLGDALAGHAIQAWLLGAHKEMLCDFLDSLGIAHDADGTVDVIPPAPAKEELAAAVDTLLTKYPAETVAVYLHVFRDMDSAVQWPPLDEILAENTRLQFQPNE